MLTIYHVPGTRSVRPIWLCEELGVPYQRVPVDFSPEYRATPEWRRLNPVGKVPAMTDDDLVMFESGAMVEYILDRHGDGRLRPARGTTDHAYYLQWSWFAESTFARPIGEMVNHRRAFDETERSEAVLEEMRDRARLCATAVDDALGEHDFLVADTFTAADIMMGYTVFLAHRLVVMAPDEFPALDRYFDRLAARPAYQRTMS